MTWRPPVLCCVAPQAHKAECICSSTCFYFALFMFPVSSCYAPLNSRTGSRCREQQGSTLVAVSRHARTFLLLPHLSPLIAAPTTPPSQAPVQVHTNNPRPHLSPRGSRFPEVTASSSPESVGRLVPSPLRTMGACGCWYDACQDMSQLNQGESSG